MGRSLVVVDVPSHETLIGQLTLAAPACVVDLLGRPKVVDGEHAYDLHYVITGHTPEARAEMEAHLDEVYTRFETLQDDGEWHVACEVPVANIRSPGLRFIAGLFALAPMPWIVFQDGVGQARLRPRDDHRLAQVAETLVQRLASIGVAAHPEVRDDLDDGFAARVATAGWRLDMA